MKDFIEVKIISDDNFNGWDRFVENSGNGTIFHLQKFLGYHPKERFKSFNLMFEIKDEVVSVIPGIEKDEEGKIFISHPGASFGGFVFKNNIGLKQIDLIIKHFIDYLKENNFKKVMINQAPLPYMGQLYECIDFLYYSNGFKVVKEELSSVVHLDFVNEQDILESLKETTRRGVKKAMKYGIYIKETSKIDNFYSILKKVLKVKHKVNPTHSFTELKELLNTFPDRIKLFGTFLKDKLIGGVVVFLCNKKNALIFYNIIDEEYQNLRPSNFQIYYVMKWLWENKIEYMDLGISSVNMQINIGLFKFKSGFGSQSFVRKQFYKELI